MNRLPWKGQVESGVGVMASGLQSDVAVSIRAIILNLWISAHLVVEQPFHRVAFRELHSNS